MSSLPRPMASLGLALEIGEIDLKLTLEGT